MTGSFGFAIEEGQDVTDTESRWAGRAAILGPQWLNLPTITIGLLGVSVFWSVEMSYASPFLLSLGLSKSWMSLVFLAGPLSGLIVQPLVGVLADRSRSVFGRRRPYMIGGSLLCVCAMLVLGYSRALATIFTPKESAMHNWIAIFLAVIAIYCIDFSINAVQAVDRALLVDTLSTTQQASANAWAARMGGIGGVAGFFIGNVDLVKIFPFIGNEQLQVLSMLASLVLMSSHAITALFVRERVLLTAPRHKKSIADEFRTIWENYWMLPKNIKQICLIQFCAWIGWFPVLFYSTVYVGELHKRAHPLADPTDLVAALALDEEATRLGSRALLYSSLLSVTGNVLLPFIITRPRGSVSPVSRSWKEYLTIHLSSLWAASHFLFILCMASTLFITSVKSATFMVTLTGLSWAVTQWAPFSLLGEAILSDPSNMGHHGTESIQLGDARSPSRPHLPSHLHLATNDDERQGLVQDTDHDEEYPDPYPDPGTPRSRKRSQSPSRMGVIMGNNRAPLSNLEVHLAAADEVVVPRVAGLAAKAGVILGIHNVFIVIPQFVASVLSTILFAIFEPSITPIHGKSAPLIHNASSIATSFNATEIVAAQDVVSTPAGVNAVAVVFQIGGLSTVGAFVFAWRLSRELRYR